MSKVDDGGPAFPSGGTVTPDGVLFEGISARDYFAAKAMAGILSSPRRSADSRGRFADSSQHVLASMAYEMADAMLAARKAQQ